VALFVLQALGALGFAFGAWIGMGLGEFDGPPVPQSTKLLLLAATIVAPLALVGAAVIVSGIADATWLIPRLLVIFTAFVVNMYGIFDQSRWFMDLARHFTAYRAMGFDVGDLESAAVVVLACATGAALLLRCGMRAVRFRPRVALLVDV
jgi:hypothetical protein